MLMGSVIVNDQVQLQIGGKLAVEPPKELEELLVAVTRYTIGDDFASQYIQSRKQGRGPVPLVIMGQGSTTSLLQGETGLGSLQGLNLTFFVYTQHDGFVGRIQIQPDDIGEFFHKALVAREFERF